MASFHTLLCLSPQSSNSSVAVSGGYESGCTPRPGCMLSDLAKQDGFGSAGIGNDPVRAMGLLKQ